MSFRKFTQRFTPWLTAYLLLVSVGLPLNRVYCACVDQEWVAVSSPVHECHHDAVTATIHHHQEAEKSCYDHGQVASSCSNHDCGDSEVLIQPLDVDFTVEWASAGIILAAFQPAVSFGSAVPHPASALSKATPIRGPSPPPLPYGRSLLVRQQTFLI